MWPASASPRSRKKIQRSLPRWWLQEGRRRGGEARPRSKDGVGKGVDQVAQRAAERSAANLAAAAERAREAAVSARRDADRLTEEARVAFEQGLPSPSGSRTQRICQPGRHARPSRTEGSRTRRSQRMLVHAHASVSKPRPIRVASTPTRWRLDPASKRRCQPSGVSPRIWSLPRPVRVDNGGRSPRCTARTHQPREHHDILLQELRRKVEDHLTVADS